MSKERQRGCGLRGWREGNACWLQILGYVLVQKQFAKPGAFNAVSAFAYLFCLFCLVLISLSGTIHAQRAANPMPYTSSFVLCYRAV